MPPPGSIRGREGRVRDGLLGVGRLRAAVEDEMAEGKGFEPPKACASPVFKTGAINHSATPPAPAQHRVHRREAQGSRPRLGGGDR